MTQEELVAAVKALQEKNGGDALTIAAKLYSDNHDVREKNRGLKEEIAALKAKVPAEGAVILDAAQAKAFDAYQKLGKAEDIGAALTRVKELEGEVSKTARRALISEAAKAHGFDPDVLLGLTSDAHAIELKTEKLDGKDVKRAYVKDGDAAPKLLDEYAAEQWPKFMPALKPGNGAGTQMIPQSSGGKAPKQDPASIYLGKAYAQPKQGS